MESLPTESEHYRREFERTSAMLMERLEQDGESWFRLHVPAFTLGILDSVAHSPDSEHALDRVRAVLDASRMFKSDLASHTPDV